MAPATELKGCAPIPARTGADGEPEVAGHPWRSAAAASIVQAAAGSDADLVAYLGPERFDVLNLLVVTDGAQDLEVLRHIRRRFDHRLGLDCWVIQPGHVRVGDPVTLAGTTAGPTRSGGWIVGRPYATTHRHHVQPGR